MPSVTVQDTMCAHFSYSALASSTALKNSSIPIPVREDTPTAWERGKGSDGGMEAGRSREIERVRERWEKVNGGKEGKREIEMERGSTEYNKGERESSIWVHM